jgi:hypothetical protein
MNRVLSALLGLVLTVSGQAVIAQDAQDPEVLPVEAYICHFRDGMDNSHIDEANGAFNRWADSAGLTGLTALMLTPTFYSSELEADIVGMDIWQNGAAMGNGVAKIASDPDSVAAYEKAVDCSAHQFFALIGVKPPSGDLTDGGMMSFQNCKLNQTRSMDDAIATATAVSELEGAWNLGDAHALLVPVAGETSDADYDFKWVSYYPSVQAFGSLFDHYAAGAVQTVEQMVDPVMACDSSRMYSVTVARTENN